jgi:hypothetical protein
MKRILLFLFITYLGLSIYGQQAASCKGSNTSTESPGPVWTFFRMVNASHAGNVDVYINDELRIENLNEAYATDTLRVHVYQPFELIVKAAGAEEILLSETFEIPQLEDHVGWLIVLAGIPDAQDQMFELDFFIFEEMRINQTEEDFYDVLVLNAFVHDYYLGVHSFFGFDLLYGDYFGYNPLAQEDFGGYVNYFTTSYHYTFNLAQHFEFGEAVHMVFYDYPPLNETTPYVMLIPAGAGALIGPESWDEHVSVPEIDGDNLQIKLFPNPVTEMLNISLEGLLPGMVYFEIVDLSGKILMHKLYRAYDHLNINWNISDLSKGYYLLRCRTSTQSVVVPVVKN